LVQGSNEDCLWFCSFRTVGKYRRVRFDDLMAYKRKDDKARAKVLGQLTAEAHCHRPVAL